MKSVLGMCFNWKVLAGLGVLALFVWTVAPQYVLTVLPLLLLAACPISMGVMAWMMRGQMGGSTAVADPQARLAELERAQARLASEILRARADAAANERALPSAATTDRSVG